MIYIIENTYVNLENGGLRNVDGRWASMSISCYCREMVMNDFPILLVPSIQTVR